LVVLGHPAGGENVFELADVKAIAEEIDVEVGVEARII
jgi:hypothetical protein